MKYLSREVDNIEYDKIPLITPILSHTLAQKQIHLKLEHSVSK